MRVVVRQGFYCIAVASGLSTQINGAMGTLPDFRTFPPDDLLGLFTCQTGYLQGYKTSKIASVAICGRSCHIMPVLYGDCGVSTESPCSTVAFPLSSCWRSTARSRRAGRGHCAQTASTLRWWCARNLRTTSARS